MQGAGGECHPHVMESAGGECRRPRSIALMRVDAVDQCPMRCVWTQWVNGQCVCGRTGPLRRWQHEAIVLAAGWSVAHHLS